MQRMICSMIICVMHDSIVNGDVDRAKWCLQRGRISSRGVANRREVVGRVHYITCKRSCGVSNNLVPHPTG